MRFFLPLSLSLSVSLSLSLSLSGSRSFFPGGATYIPMNVVITDQTLSFFTQNTDMPMDWKVTLTTDLLWKKDTYIADHSPGANKDTQITNLSRGTPSIPQHTVSLPWTKPWRLFLQCWVLDLQWLDQYAFTAQASTVSLGARLNMKPGNNSEQLWTHADQNQSCWTSEMIFQNRNPKHRHSHYKKRYPFFKKQWNWHPFHVPRGTRPMLKRTPFYRKILVGDDNIMAQVAPPGFFFPFLYGLLRSLYNRVGHDNLHFDFSYL